MADRAKSTTRFVSSVSDTEYPPNSRRIWFSSRVWIRAGDKTPRMRRRHFRAGSKRSQLPELQSQVMLPSRHSSQPAHRLISELLQLYRLLTKHPASHATRKLFGALETDCL